MIPSNERSAVVETLRLALLETLDSYHSNIREQRALVERLIETVSHEERRRCAGVATAAAAVATSEEGRAVAQAIARDIGSASRSA